MTAALLLLAMLGTAGCAEAPAPEALAPLERQVLQRDAAGGATLTVRVRAAAARVEAAVRTAAGERGEWFELAPAGGEPGLWRGQRRVAAGGWHSLWLRLDGVAAPAPAVARFGVGEVFLLAGQSNSTNSGETAMPGVNDRVSAFDGVRWRTAADPMPGVQDRSRGGSPWPVFGDLMQRALGVPVGLAAVGHGNTSILDWQPDTAPVSPHLGGRRLYPGLRDRLRALGGARAVLWHQGESDADRGTPADEYVAAFRRLAGALAADTGQDPTWLVARASYLPFAAAEAQAAVRRAQETLWRDGDARPGPSTDELQGRLRARDRIHFSAAGLRVHGELWYAAAMSGLFDGGPPPAR